MSASLSKYCATNDYISSCGSADVSTNFDDDNDENDSLMLAASDVEDIIRKTCNISDENKSPCALTTCSSKSVKISHSNMPLGHLPMVFNSCQVTINMAQCEV